MSNKKNLEMCLFGLHIGDACSTKAESSDIQFACQFGIWYKEDSKVRIGFKELARHSSYSLSCQELDENIDITLMFVQSFLKLVQQIGNREEKLAWLCPKVWKKEINPTSISKAHKVTWYISYVSFLQARRISSVAGQLIMTEKQSSICHFQTSCLYESNKQI